MKKVFIICLLLVLLTACTSSNTQNSNLIDSDYTSIDSENNDKSFEENPERDDMLYTVIETIFSVTDDDYLEGEFDYIVSKSRKNNIVKDYFTEAGYSFIDRSGMMTGVSHNYSNYYCLSQVENMVLDYRQTSKPNELVCFFETDVVTSFEEDSTQDLRQEAFGEMTLYYSDDQWQIDFLKINNMRSLYSSFNDFVREEDIYYDETGVYLYTKFIYLLKHNMLQVRLNHLEDVKNIIDINNDQIKFGALESEYLSIVNFDSIETNDDEKSIVFHIVAEVDMNDVGKDQKLIEVDYYDKVVFSDYNMTYYYKYNTDEEVISHWTITHKSFE